MTTNLTPDVRDAAAQALRHKLRGVIPAIWLIDGEIWTEAIDAVVAVVAPQIARPLQARITELEAALAFMLKRFDPAGDMATLRTTLAGAEKPDDQLAALEAEFPEKAPMVRQAMKDAPAAILRLRARVDELEAALTDDDKLLRFGVDRGLISDHAHKLILQRDTLKARVEVLTAALTELLDRHDNGWKTPGVMLGHRVWENARAALAAGKTESEA